MRKLFLLGLLLLPKLAFSQFAPGAIQNTAVPLNGQFNITSGTVRGPFYAGSVTASTITVGTITITGAFVGSGTFLSNLNASSINSGTISTNVVSGNYTNITGVGVISSGSWASSVIGSSFGGTGVSLGTAAVGSLPYITSVGTMGALSPGTSGYILQGNGVNAALNWTNAPTIKGNYISTIPVASLQGGPLPMNVLVNDASISSVSLSKIGNFSVSSNVWTGQLPIASGGTNAASPSVARANLGAAQSGSNSDLSVLNGTQGVGAVTFTTNTVTVGSATFQNGNFAASSFTVTGGSAALAYQFSPGSINMAGPSANFTSNSSVTAGAFFGDGSHLTLVGGGGVLNGGNVSSYPKWSSVNGLTNSFTSEVSSGVSVSSHLFVAGNMTLAGSSFTIGGSSFTLYGGSLTVANRVTAKSFSGPLASASFVDLSTVTTQFTTKASSGTNADLGRLTGIGAGITLSTNAVVVGSETVQGSGFSVGGSSFIIAGGSATVAYQLTAGSINGPLTSASFVDLSTVTTALATKASSGTNTDVTYLAGPSQDGVGIATPTAVGTMTVSAMDANGYSLRLASSVFFTGGGARMGDGTMFYSTNQFASNGTGFVTVFATSTITAVHDNLLPRVDGVRTVFTLSSVATSSAAVQLYLNGGHLSDTTDYIYSNGNISLSTAPSTNSNSFDAYYFVYTASFPAVAVLNQVETFTTPQTFASGGGNYSLTASSGISLGGCLNFSGAGSQQCAPATVASTQFPFADNFTGYATDGCHSDGFDFGMWNVAFAGGGCVQMVSSGTAVNHILQQATAVSGAPLTSHASFTEIQPSISGPMSFVTYLNTVSQLRTGSSPNANEMAQVVWNYTDASHYYAFIPELSGWSLIKEDPAYPGNQRTLATGATPVTLGTWHKVRVAQDVTDTIYVYLDEVLLTVFQDTATPYTSGFVGEYVQDALGQAANAELTYQTLSSSGAITGSGPSGYLPVFTAQSVVGGSNLSQDSSQSITFVGSSITVQGVNTVIASSGIAAIPNQAGVFVSTNLYAAGVINGSGAGLTALNASNLTSGAAPVTALAGNYSGITGLGTITSPVNVSNVGLTLSGANGNVTTASSVTANAFFGDGSNITGISGSLSGGATPKVPYWTAATTLGNSALYRDGSGTSMSLIGSSLTVNGNLGVTGANNVITSSGITAIDNSYGVFFGTSVFTPSKSSVTAGFFIGDGSGLTNLQGLVSNTATSSFTVIGNLGIQGANSVLVSSGVTAIDNSYGVFFGTSVFTTSKSSVTAGYLIGNGAGITGISGSLSGGTTRAVPFYTNSTTLGNSNLYSDISGTSLSLIASSMTVNGKLAVTGSNNVLVSSGITATDNSFGVFFGTSVYTTSKSSVTAGFVLGNGAGLTSLTAANLSGTVPNGSLVGNYSNVTGLGTLSSALNINNVALTASGANGKIVGASSITTTGAFFGDGTSLTFGDGQGMTFSTGTTFTSSVTLTGANSVLVSSGIAAPPGQPGVTFSTNIYASNVGVSKGGGFFQAPMPSTVAVYGKLLFISSEDVSGATTTISNGSNMTVFSTYNYLGGTLSNPGDSILIECAFRNDGSAPTSPVQWISSGTVTTVAGTTELAGDADTTANEEQIVRYSFTLLSNGRVLPSYAMLTHVTYPGSTANNNVTVGVLEGEVPFSSNSNQSFNCAGRTSGGGNVNFAWMRVIKQ